MNTPSPKTISESSGMGVKSTSSRFTKLLPFRVRERNSVFTAFQTEASWKQLEPIVMEIRLVLRDMIKFSPFVKLSSPRVTSSRYLQPSVKQVSSPYCQSREQRRPPWLHLRLWPSCRPCGRASAWPSQHRRTREGWRKTASWSLHVGRMRYSYSGKQASRERQRRSLQTQYPQCCSLWWTAGRKQTVKNKSGDVLGEIRRNMQEGEIVTGQD